jgi:hypothetical protein
LRHGAVSFRGDERACSRLFTGPRYIGRPVRCARGRALSPRPSNLREGLVHDFRRQELHQPRLQRGVRGRRQVTRRHQPLRGTEYRDGQGDRRVLSRQAAVEFRRFLTISINRCRPLSAYNVANSNPAGSYEHHDERGWRLAPPEGLKYSTLVWWYSLAQSEAYSGSFRVGSFFAFGADQYEVPIRTAGVDAGTHFRTRLRRAREQRQRNLEHLHCGQRELH